MHAELRCSGDITVDRAGCPKQAVICMQMQVNEIVQSRCFLSQASTIAALESSGKVVGELLTEARRGVKRGRE